MASGKSVITSLIAGAAAGFAAGLLFAPQSGEATRGKLSFRLKKYKDRLEEIIEDLTDQKEVIFSEARAEGEKVIEDTKKRAEAMLADVDQLINQIHKEETNGKS